MLLLFPQPWALPAFVRGGDAIPKRRQLGELNDPSIRNMLKIPYERDNGAFKPSSGLERTHEYPGQH